ncbi:MAG: hypothetical protein E6936_10805 [Clostridium perfringens]|uniref:hypothetical protein n=1 Tax=Clostridium perfringens TaxID=1502 RepID=UPI0013D1B691|nr:hypothetical protein [Clostridium perfringens]EGT5618553.1 hypothetical protein [Clostridium perfringens]KAF2784004.1 hypothetical protein SV13_07310 [Clostridium perfringens]MDU1307933.1 hypothetical protein [Clostridium perfringens]HAT4357536.1 hypothetical protein [Clostridium perfringens]
MEYDQNYYGLSTPKVFTSKDLMLDIRKEYDILFKNFIDPKIRPKVKGIPIFIKNEKECGMEERFLHCISMEDKGYYKSILPCSNLPYSNKCIPKCKIENANFTFSKLKRVECQYRLARVQWIPQIIKYANEDDPRITMWRYDKKDKSGKWYWCRYIRYRSEFIDFLIVFNELYDKQDKTKLNYLDFRSAYPIFKPHEGADLDKQAKKYPL